MPSALMDTYARLDICFSRGEGCYLYDEGGKPYLDAIAGIGVNSLGHAHPAVTAAIAEQAGRLLHTSNLYRVELQEHLAERLAEVANIDACFFGNSGAEANEAALKLARLYGRQRGIERPAVLVMEDAFHGRTLATLTAGGNRRIQAGFEPLLGGFVRAPFNDTAALGRIAENNDDIAAVLLEPIQGEGGVRPAAEGYLAELRAICDERGWLLMLDEAQTGNCRCGTWYACQLERVAPDVITTAKALGNGVPIGACMARGEAARVLQPGNHGSTFGGNPLACAAALAVIATMEREGLAARATTLGERIRAGLRARLEGAPGVVEIRGRGMMIGIELAAPCGDVPGAALEAGLLINVTAGNTIRLLPPLIMSEEQADSLVETLGGLILRALEEAA